MQTRTKYGLALVVLAAALAGGLAWFARRGRAGSLSAGALDAIPSGALIVATFDVPALRASPVGAPFLREEREIPGLGKVKDVCGFDPVAWLTEVAVAIPAADDGGDFGLAAAGDIQDEQLLACASKVIEGRGGRPVVTQIGSFRAVRDADNPAAGGEIAVRRGGPILLGGGPYLRAMIDSADGRTEAIRASVAHSQLARDVGAGAARATVVLTPDQRSQLAEELSLSGAGSSPAASILAGGVSVSLGPEVAVHAVIACTTDAACAELGVRLRAARDARAEDMATRLVGFGALLERVELTAEGPKLHVRVTAPAEEAGTLIERLVTLRGLRHPMPENRPPQASPPPAKDGTPPANDAPPAKGDEPTRRDERPTKDAAPGGAGAAGGKRDAAAPAPGGR